MTMTLPAIPESHRDLLDNNQVAILATVGPDGSPQVTASWFLVEEDGTVKMSLNTARQKVKNLMRHPESTLFFMDPANPYRTLEIRARAEIEPDPDYVFADRVGRQVRRRRCANDGPARRDAGGDHVRPGQSQHVRLIAGDLRPARERNHTHHD